jgi:Aminopeptidase N
VLRTLEGIIGEDKVREALHLWFTRYRFTHPTGEDFMRTVQEVAGPQDLKWFFDAAIRGTQVLDYEIRGARSEPVEYWKEGGNPKEKMWRSFVLVHRKGDFIFPVDVAVHFDTGETARERWDGRDRWIRYTYDRKGVRVKWAEVDPDHKVWLDRDRYNNSRTDRARRQSRRRLQAGKFLDAAQRGRGANPDVALLRRHR